MIENNRSALSRILIVPLLILALTPAGAQVRIAEFLAANVSTNLDPDAYEFSDWLELHNPGDQAADLTGFFLTDDLGDPEKWRIPRCVIEPGQRLLFWADGLDLPAGDLPPSVEEDLDIFADELPPDWEIRSRSRATVDARETTIVHQGRHSLAVHANLFTIDILLASPVDPTGYGTLAFAFHPGDAVPGLGNSSFNVLLDNAGVARLLGDDVDGTRIDLDDEQWQVIEIPLEHFELEQPLTQITLGGNLLGTFYLDDIRLVRPDLPAYHAGFKLNQDGEEIGLFSSDGILVDSVAYGPQIPDVSQGRHPENRRWLFFADPTPGAANSDAGLPEPAVAAPPEFSLPAGFHQGPQTLTLAHPHPDAVIRYTLDGSIPTSISGAYTAPLTIEATTVLRARAFVPGRLPGPVLTRTFFIDEEISLPVFSISTDPENLWDDQIGIYVDGVNGIIADDSVFPKNSNQPWERPAHVEFYETSGFAETGSIQAFSQQIGLSIYGAFSRHLRQKSLSIIARDKYGAGQIRHRLFFDKPIDRFNSFILRNGGNDWLTTMLDDPFMQTLVEGRMDVDLQDYRPAVVFLNGRYWGVHNIREKLNRYYASTNYGADPDEIDIIEGDGLPKAGDAEHYRTTIGFLETHDLDDPESYAQAARLIDVVEYMNVQIALVYYGPFDNFFKNVKCWRPRTPDGRWRWFLYDTDHGFGNYKDNALEVATDPRAENRFGDISWGTLILRKLLENPEFRDDFIQRFAAHVSYTFAPGRALAIIDSLQAGIEPEMPRHIERWKDDCMEHAWWGTFCGISSMSSWRSGVSRLRTFARNRPAYVREHLREYFGLSGMIELRTAVNESGGGRILVNDVPADTSGLFFAEVPLRVKAEPRPGYRFSGWRGALTGALPETTLVLEKGVLLEATFAPVEPEPALTGLRLNEIAASNDSLLTDEYGENDDWIEIYNTGPAAVDIGGLYLTDRFDRPTLWRIPSMHPDSTTVEPGGFLVLWADRDPEQGILHADFRLDADGEQLALVQLRGIEPAYLDSFTFGPQETDVAFGRYPDGAAGLGRLSAPTPGGPNPPLNTLIEEESATDARPEQFALRPNYPNPFNGRTTIPYEIPRPAFVRLEIFSVTGQRIATLISAHRPAGCHQVIWDEEGRLANGVYFYRLEAGTFTRTRRLLLMK